MADQTHTQEPWMATGRCIKRDYREIGLGEEGEIIAGVVGGSTSGPFFIANDEECDANARRIVACVNACAGFSSVELEEVIKHGGFIDQTRYNAMVTQQRDQLLTAAKQAAAEIRRCDYTPARSTLLTAIAAIEKADARSAEGGAS